MGSPSMEFRGLLKRFLYYISDDYKSPEYDVVLLHMNLEKLEEQVNNLIRDIPHDEVCYIAGMVLANQINYLVREEHGDRLNAMVSGSVDFEKFLGIEKRQEDEDD